MDASNSRDSIELSVTVALADESSLRSFAQELGWPPQGDIRHAVSMVVCHPAHSPETTGYVIREVACGPGSEPGSFKVRMAVEVFDASAVVLEARARYAARFEDNEWQPVSLGEALHEVLHSSNALPPVRNVGLVDLGPTFDRDIELEPSRLLPAGPSPGR